MKFNNSNSYAILNSFKEEIYEYHPIIINYRPLDNNEIFGIDYNMLFYRVNINLYLNFLRN